MKAPQGRKFLVVGLQFKFPKLGAVPPFTRQMVQATAKTKETQELPTGTQVLEPTEGISLVTTLDDLESANYSLVNVICEERKNSSGFGTHYVARFVFAAPSSRMRSTPTFLRRKDVLRKELQAICESALWRARGYANPFRRNGRLVPDAATANVVFDSRKPFIQGDGQPVMVWPTDTAGERIGEKPLPLAPDFHLRAPMGRALQLQAL